MKVIVVGALGRMGRSLLQELEKAGIAVAAKVDSAGGEGVYRSVEEVKEDADALVDFSSREATEGILRFAAKRKMPVVIASTGHTEEDRALIARAAESIPIFFSSNMSFGVALFIALCERIARAFRYADVEIIEAHHTGKLDAPSGTALAIADKIIAARGFGEKVVGRRTPHRHGDVGISSLRIGAVAGVHEVVFDTGIQRFTLKHEASSRKLYAVGAIGALRFVVGRPAGLYGMSDLPNMEQ